MKVSDDFVMDLLMKKRRWYRRMVVFLPCVVLVPMLMAVVMFLKIIQWTSHGGFTLIQWSFSLSMLPLAVLSLVSVFMVTTCPPTTEHKSLDYMMTARRVSLAWWLGVFSLLAAWEISALYEWGTEITFVSPSVLMNLYSMLLFFGGMVTLVLSIPMLVVLTTYWSELADELKVEHRYSKATLSGLLIIAGIISLLIMCPIMVISGSLIIGFVVWLLILLGLFLIVVLIMVLIGATVTWQGACACHEKSLSEIEQWAIMQEKQKMGVEA